MAKPRRAPARRSPKRSARRKAAGRRAPRLRWKRVVAGGLALALVGAGLYVAWLDYRIRAQFEGGSWDLPARLFARPLDLYEGRALRTADLVEELRLLRYRKVGRVTGPGQYRSTASRVYFHSRRFPLPDGDAEQRLVRVDIRGGRISGLHDAASGESLDLMRLQPVPIASIYPQHNEDRIVVRLEDTPPLLVQTLVTVEDHRFHEHHGLDVTAIARAMVANLQAGRTVQGGSTLTQQLIKNYFLDRERSLWRKLTEAVMALSLEVHYDKDAILQAYLNEVYLGQDGNRAIHGFALASQFWFARTLDELAPEHIALLVAMVKGPSYYDPRRHPDRATARRNLVLGMLAEAGVLSAEEAGAAAGRPLGVTEKAPTGTSPFPAFLQLARQQLRRHYRDEDLRAEGLMVFTTMDPVIQIRTERAMGKRLAGIERARGIRTGTLQGAAVVTDVQTGEVLALVGGRDPRFAGYNRALAAQRPIGSLIKPVVYLAALEQPTRYTLVTRLSDGPVTVRLENGKRWSPRNYDRESHGEVPLQDALVHSYNQSTARLGMEVGLQEVAQTLERLGLDRPVPRFPSLLLGAVELSPLEVSQVYQTLAAGGYEVPLKSIRAVVDAGGGTLQRYPLEVRRVADPAAVFLLQVALNEVTRSGTARSLGAVWPGHPAVAGKTGTTNDLRDSWFAGFAGDYLAVVWVGRDDNGTTGLTGATGALPVWADIMHAISSRGLNLEGVEGVSWVRVDPATGLRADGGCDDARRVPFIAGSAPRRSAPCARAVRGKRGNPVTRWLEGILD